MDDYSNIPMIIIFFIRISYKTCDITDRYILIQHHSVERQDAAIFNRNISACDHFTLATPSCKHHLMLHCGNVVRSPHGAEPCRTSSNVNCWYILSLDVYRK